MFDLNLEAGRRLMRLRLNRDEADRLTRDGIMVVDDRRRRPQWFDGRFLAARDLTNEQNYVLTRQADLGKAGGVGVVRGLEVVADRRGLRIQPGFGLTSLGEMVIIPRELTLQVQNIPQIERLNRTFGLSRVPAVPPRTLTGLFIVALRAVEYTANPIVSYPTAVEGERSVEDGDIIEATAVTLIPFSDGATSSELDQRRAEVAYAMFVEHAERELPVGTLPLAMVALNRGSVEWIDPFLVRREIGAEHADVIGLGPMLGFATRATREAHLLQYDMHLTSVLDRQGGRPFSATDYFRVLPPAGRLPRSAVNPNDFTQTYFPPGIEVDLSLVPVDELNILLEESLVLPPIDLTLTADQLESTSIQIIIPISRTELRQRINQLESTMRLLRPAAPGLVAARKPLEALRTLRLPQRLPPPILDPASLADRAWQEVLQRAEQLWFVRRRNFHYKAELVGTIIPLPVEPPVDGGEGGGDEVPDRTLISENRLLDALGERDLPNFYFRRFAALRSAARENNTWESVVTLLDNARWRSEPFLLAGSIHEMSLVEGMQRTNLRNVARRYQNAGQGYATLRRLDDAVLTRFYPELIVTVPRFLLVPEIDQLITQFSNQNDIATINEFLLKMGQTLREGDLSPEEVFQAMLEQLTAAGIRVTRTNPAEIPFFPRRGE
ncbi:hypothetical protein EYB53_016730 [Candidatus Chloroploca sp. M-50]|uniref:Uncharacterized protein n=1 Tax=Candidatus Chloroploca mongolica TaxID=2528176 RepID=A0ABS4DD32_9CHLR|nr:hypothetical protein [Candidatus Chloroploca mongolica]MBP1467360.1 hypothetical protein [Candidatus Chloroploca mongolica]